MHDQRTPAQDGDLIDRAILRLLTDAPALWSVAEVTSEIGSETATTDGLARLAGAGLIHRLDQFVFATRAAFCGQRLAL